MCVLESMQHSAEARQKHQRGLITLTSLLQDCFKGTNIELSAEYQLCSTDDDLQAACVVLYVCAAAALSTVHHYCVSFVLKDFCNLSVICSTTFEGVPRWLGALTILLPCLILRSYLLLVSRTVTNFL